MHVDTPAVTEQISDERPDYPPLVDLGRVLGFFASVIKSGEPWSETCQREYEAANAALQSALTELQQRRASDVTVSAEIEHVEGDALSQQRMMPKTSLMGKEQELRPCPLCRKTMQLAQFSDWEERDLPVQHIVHPVPSTCPLAGVQIEATSENIAAWNRRSSDEQAEVVSPTRQLTLGEQQILHNSLRDSVTIVASPPAVAAGGVTAVEAAQMARTRLINFANEANAGRAQAGGRELARKVWGAFAEFDRLTAALAVGDEGIREGWPEHASPLPWKYVRVDHGLGQVYDRIEDASGGVVVEHVGHIDGPAICAAVNAPTPPSRGEGE